MVRVTRIERATSRFQNERSPAELYPENTVKPPSWKFTIVKFLFKQNSLDDVFLPHGNVDVKVLLAY